MALSDYSTSAEKIAALKAAMIDPALMNMETGTLNVSEDIYLVTWHAYLNSLYLTADCSSYSYIMPKLSSGDVLTQAEATAAFMYIKDSDIVYSDPITTYQDRLSKISESNMKIGDGTIFTAGANGCIVLTLEGGTPLDIDGKRVIYLNTDARGRPLYVPVRSGWTVYTYGDRIVYIDLPSDW